MRLISILMVVLLLGLVKGQPMGCQPSTWSSTNDQCYSCQTNFYLDQNTSTCNACPTGNYSSNGSNVTYCEPCDSNCSTCYGNSRCSSCVDGTYLDQGTCYSCPDGCMKCNSTHCLTCHGVSDNTSSCNVCLNYCTSCNNQSCPFCYQNINVDNKITCHYCDQGEYIQNNECYSCPTNCLACTSIQCLTCLSPYYYLDGFSCTACQSPCRTCTNNTNCLSCPTGKFINGSTCSSCPLYCQTCNSTNCFACKSLYYANGFNCSPCPSKCTSCRLSTNCTSCNQNQYLQNATCIQCINKAVNKSNSTNEDCLKCPNICVTCISYALRCNTCATNYYLANGTCIQCTNGTVNPSNNSNPNCLTCPNNCIACTSDSLNCNTCAQNYYLKNTTCIQCTYNTVNSSNNSNPNCLTCPNNCVACTSDALRCITCATNYYLGNGTCIQCTNNTVNPSNNTNPNCLRCSNNCITCTSDALRCKTCAQDYYLGNGTCIKCSDNTANPSNNSNQNCLTCPNNCVTCTSDAVNCNTCAINFFLVNNSCICGINQTNFNSQCYNNCGFSNCVNCLNGNCLQCMVNYFFNTFTNSCNLFCNINQCSVCSSHNYCDSCSSNLTVNIFGDSCLISCNFSNCFSCNKSYYCYKCNDGYSLVNNTCIACSVSNCAFCKQNNLCSLCSYPYSTQNGQCLLCLPPCQTCFSDGSCLTCQQPYSQIYLSRGNKCFLCNDPNCINCKLSNPGLCIECTNGYSIINGICNLNCSQAHCIQCGQINRICSQCANYYFINSADSTCALCPNTPQCINCNYSNPKQCVLCSAGFFINSGQCSPCHAYCSSCISATICTTLTNSVGQVLMTINGESKLAACDPGCVACSSTNPSKCSNCTQGYVFKSGVCLICSLNSNCQTCSNNNLSQCTSCFPNNFLNNVSLVCQSCTFPCVTCASINQLSFCTSCPTVYSLNNGVCTPPSINNRINSSCGLNCANCVFANGIYTCKLCLMGSVLSSINDTFQICLPCLAGCSLCSSSTYGTCLKCFQGNYLDIKNGYICSPCSSNCFNCIQIVCLKCNVGYFLNSDFNCQKVCAMPCTTCNQSDSPVCKSCIVGYTFNRNNTPSCLPDLSCNIKQNCLVCPFGYILIVNTASQTQNCLSCSQNSNCARCSQRNVALCTSCSKGSYLNDKSLCVYCPSFCSSCISSTNCIDCQPGYFGSVPASLSTVNDEVTSILQIVQCVACSPPCATCINSPYTCLTCTVDFYYQGNQCVSNFNYGVGIVLGVTQGIFYQNYYQFLNQIANPFGPNIYSLTITAINSGSTIVSLFISSTATYGSYQARLQQSNLQSIVSNPIAGMPVTSWSVSVNYKGNSALSESGKSNIVIILAITMPVVVALFLVLFLIVYRIKIQQKQPAEFFANQSPISSRMPPIKVQQKMTRTNVDSMRVIRSRKTKGLVVTSTQIHQIRSEERLNYENQVQIQFKDFSSKENTQRSFRYSLHDSQIQDRKMQNQRNININENILAGKNWKEESPIKDSPNLMQY